MSSKGRRILNAGSKEAVCDCETYGFHTVNSMMIQIDIKPIRFLQSSGIWLVKKARLFFILFLVDAKYNH